MLSSQMLLAQVMGQLRGFHLRFNFRSAAKAGAELSLECGQGLSMGVLIMPLAVCLLKRCQITYGHLVGWGKDNANS